METRPMPRSAVAATCALLLGAALVMATQSLALAGDGAWQLLQVLKTGDPFGLDARILGAWARQVPVVVATRAGVTDTHDLTLLFGAGQLLVPALAWSLAILLSRPNRLVCAAVTLTAGLCAGVTWAFSVLESIVAVPLTILVAVLLWRPQPWRRRDVALALLTSFVLVASYETALVTGAVLAVWAGWRATGAGLALERYACWTVAALSAASVAVAAVGTQRGSNPTNSQSIAYFVVSLEPWPFYLALLGIVTVVAGLGPWLAGVPRLLTVGAGCGALVVSVAAFDAAIVTAFQARGGTVLAALLLMAFLFWSWIRSQQSVASIARSQDGSAEPLAPAAARLLVAVPTLFVAAMLVANVPLVASWASSLDAFRSAVDRRQGIVIDVEALPPGEREVLWSWTSSSLSLIVRPRPDAAILVNRDPTIVPFPPQAARDELDDAFAWRS
jgi:hypothetical protein